MRTVDIFPDHTKQEIVIGVLNSHSNLTTALAIVPFDKHTKGDFEKSMKRAKAILGLLMSSKSLVVKFSHSGQI